VAAGIDRPAAGPGLFRPVEWPLVGRTTELGVVEQLIAGEASSGVVVAGMAGAGKTRLLRRCADVAEAAGMSTAWVTGTRSLAAIPFGAMTALLEGSLTTQAESNRPRAKLLRSLMSELARRADGRPLALLLDDAHLLDPASAALAHQFATSGNGRVLATVRTGEEQPPEITALWKDGLALRLELRPLSSSDVNALLRAVLGADVEPSLAKYLTERAEGNAMFVTELIGGAIEDRTLSAHDGVWRLVGSIRPTQRLVELVEERLSGLSSTEHALLEAVCYGEPLGTAELTAMGGLDAAEGLERQGLLTSRLDGQRLSVRLAHPLYSDILRARLPAVRLRKIAATLAGAVENAGARRRDDTLRAAVWHLDCGGGSSEQLVAAAVSARWRYDVELAERLAQAAVRAGGSFQAELLLAQLAGLQGRTGEADDRLATLADTCEDPQRFGVLALARMDNLVYGLGRHSAGLEVADAAAARVTDRAQLDEIAARRAGILIASEGPSAGLGAVTPLLERVTGPALTYASLAASYCLSRTGRVVEALEAATHGRAAQKELSTPSDWYLWFHDYERCVALAAAGRFDEVEAIAQGGRDRGAEEGSDEARAFFAWQQARSVADHGHALTATRLALDASELFAKLGRPVFTRSALLAQATATALTGHAERAKELLVHADALEVEAPAWSIVDELLARVWTALACGNPTTAQQHAIQAASRGASIGDLVGAGQAYHTSCRLGRDEPGRTALESLAEETHNELLKHRATHACAISSRDPELLEQVAVDFDTGGAHLLAAEATAEAAALWRDAGEPRRAAAAQRHAAALTDRCEGARTPSLLRAGPIAALTPAERETALMVHHGLTNKDIAAHLHLSVRTVENRLQHCYEKLGVHSRAELAAAIEQQFTAEDAE
jgi:DNA-binding CsgD family transcriptional regulator